jgi:sugar lactone lactonase YvrE
MGIPSRNDGSILRADLAGANIKTIVPEGATFTPKQLQRDERNGKLYWCDREGMRVMRVNLDGSKLETLVDTSNGDSRPGPDQTKWCVGIALDIERGHIYWTQKGNDNAGQGRIFRAGMEIPEGQTPSTRKDIELLYESLPEPIDLDLDLNNRTIYWTDRGDPPPRQHGRSCAHGRQARLAQSPRNRFHSSHGGNRLGAGPQEQSHVHD